MFKMDDPSPASDDQTSLVKTSPTKSINFSKHQTVVERQHNVVRSPQRPAARDSILRTQSLNSPPMIPLKQG